MSEIKAIAMYLPQFHQVPENDEWWGKGFTEWVAVKGAEKLFLNHNQPRVPLNDNYYSLMEKETLSWQAELMKKYNVGGMCFYHYYFKDGRKILEKPAELLLKNTDIEMPFCFCWANQTWARTWSKLRSKNFWSSKHEESELCEDEGILLDQKYGREREWVIHFNYLLPFFKDSRYIKINNKPVLLIYLPKDISGFAEMAECWNKLARENGIPGIYFIGENTNETKKGLDATMYSGPIAYWNPNIPEFNAEPTYIEGIKCFTHDQLWENALIAPKIGNAKTYYGGFVDYDDTPRKGSKGTVLVGDALSSFEKYLYILAEKNIKEGSEFLFINAWNEWGEGMYLEPDQKQGYKYLEVVKQVIERINEKYRCVEYTSNEYENIKEKSREEHLITECKKYREYFDVMGKWMTLKENSINMGNYLSKYGYNTVAVYGMGIMGEHFVKEVSKVGIEVKYFIDRDSNINHMGIERLSLDEDLPEVDAIVITPFYHYDEVHEALRTKVDYPLLSLLEIIKEI